MRSRISTTNEGGVQYDHSGNKLLEFFAKAGSAFTRRPDKNLAFYENAESALGLFKQAWSTGRKTICMKLLFWLRDCRGGAGNRSGFRQCIEWLAGSPDSAWLAANLHSIPKHGRWDDLRVLFGTPLRRLAAQLWAKAIAAQDVLAAKWADRSDKPLIPCLIQVGVNNEGKLRKLLSSIRKDHIVEAKMCADDWKEIEYKTVPSVAMARYTKAFGKHDARRFAAFKEKVKKGEVAVHAETLFPHDCVRTAKNGDADMADLQFDALPNYMEGNDQRIMVLCDTSGSMQSPIAGSIHAIDVSMALALYCSDRVGKDNPFYRKFLGFESEASFKHWEGMTMSEAISNHNVFDGACGGTNIGAALDYILGHAKVRKVKKNQMPTALLIISDMQFHSGGRGGSGSEVSRHLDAWEQAGYDRPVVIYWNISPYAGQPEKSTTKDVALISGFSPAILKTVLTAEEVAPLDVMMAAIEKYEVVEPTAKELEAALLAHVDSVTKIERKRKIKSKEPTVPTKRAKPTKKHWLQ